MALQELGGASMFVKISDFRQIQTFSNLYGQISGSAITPTALSEFSVYGFYKSQHCSGPAELIGGFAIGSKGPFRSLKAIIDPSPLNLDHLVDAEICCLWLAREHRSMSNRLKMVWAMYRALFTGGHSRVLAITTKKNLWEKVYQPSGAQFMTHAKADFGFGVVKQAWLFTVTRRNVLVLGFMNVLLRPISHFNKNNFNNGV